MEKDNRTYIDWRCGNRVLRDWSDGEQEDVTPICTNRTKGNGGESSTKCSKNAKVVYCGGKAVDCGSYANGRRLKTLFDRENDRDLRPDLQVKIDRAIKLIKSIRLDEGEAVEVAYSGGKDSDVILQLAKESGINYRAIYKNTTIDPAGTIKHARDKGVEVLQPKMNFGTLIEKYGIPGRHYRFCCAFLKEYKVSNKVIIGVRRAESVKRAKRYTEPTGCRYYGAKTEKNHVVQYYPILDWTNDDVKDFIVDRGIKLHPLYYTENGDVDVSRRLGCMCCPLASNKKRLEEFRKYPLMLRYYIRHAQIFLDTHQDGKTGKYKDAYEWMCRELFYGKQVEFEMSKATGLFENTIDYKQFLENDFNVEL